MKDLFKLLERFSRSLNKDHLTKEAVALAIKNHTGASLPEENIFLKEGVLQIEAGAALKNEIRLKEEAIKSELKELHRVPVVRILYK